MLVEVKGEEENNYYVVDEANLTGTVLMYLRAHIEDYTDDEFVQDVISMDEHKIEEDQEIVKLKALVADLR